eukprot:1156785-Pelagomonas_calceolata.AAC.18
MAIRSSVLATDKSKKGWQLGRTLRGAGHGAWARPTRVGARQNSHSWGPLKGAEEGCVQSPPPRKLTWCQERKRGAQHACVGVGHPQSTTRPFSPPPPPVLLAQQKEYLPTLL